MEPLTADGYRLLVQAVEEYGLFLLSPEGVVMSWNEGAKRLAGYDADEIIGEHFQVLYTEEDRRRGAPDQALRRAREEGRFEADGWRVRKDGSRFWAHVVISPLIDEEGDLLGYAKVSHDRTAEHRAERELQDSEERYRILLEMIPQIMWIADPDGRVEFFSRRWYDYTGHPPGEADDWSEYTHPDDVEETSAAWAHAVETGEPLEHESRIRGRDGSYRWFLERASPQRDGRGDIIRWVGTLTDIQAPKEELEGEKALRDAIAAVGAQFSSDEVMQQIAERAVSATDAQGAMVTVVDAHRDRAEVKATWGEVPPPRSFEACPSVSRRVIEEGVHPAIECIGSYGGADREEVAAKFRDWSMLVVPLPLGNESIGALQLFRPGGEETFRKEVIERARVFGELAGVAYEKIQMVEREAARREELERVTESRVRLMRGFGHDVKNPLATADGFAQLLEEGMQGEMSEEQIRSVRGIRRSIQASLQLIGDLMELARAESGQIEIQLVPADLMPLVRELCEDFRPPAEAEGLELRVRAQGELVIQTDPARVKQILSNLLSNAVKYTEEGRIDVHVRREDDRVGVEVADTGPGIPEERQETIFQEFTRLDPDAPHGSGVGLAISQRIAQLLDGEITVESEEGKGSTFTLWLPAR